MSHNTKQDIMRLVEENDVQFIRLQFADVFGTLKNVAITARQLEKALDNKVSFDGSSIDGFVRIDESDMYLYPCLDSFNIFPWRSSRGNVARLICDVYRPDGVPFEGDCRSVLKKVLRKAARMGYNFVVGPECEFFLFHTDEEGRPTTITHEKAGYFDVAPLDLGENARRDIVLTLEDMGFEIEESHHEVAPAQHEIDFKYSNALKTADDIMTFKFVVKSIAKRNGLFASFMPKPVSDVDGSGMHINMSLWKEGRNIFFDKTGYLQISEEGYMFLAGIMKYAPEMALVTNPLINSYKRLVPGYEAPIDVTWSTCNRSPMIRIPTSRGSGTRLEFRAPDAAANPYLALAVLLEAGLRGIEERMDPPPHVEGNLYTMSREEKDELGIRPLPRDMRESLRLFRQSEFMKEVLGEHIFNKYCSAKKAELKSYQSQVTDWEIKEYLYKI